MKSMVGNLLATLGTAAILAGCATLPAGIEVGASATPEPLRLSVGYDAAQLRVDLRRETHPVRRFIEEPDSGGVLRIVPEVFDVKNPYSYLVTELGNGLIVDSNGNLALDLLRLYRLSSAHNYSIMQRFNTLLTGSISLRKQGNILERFGGGSIIEHTRAITDGSVVAIPGGLFAWHARIVIGKGSISYEPSGRRDGNTVTLTQRSGNLVTSATAGETTTYRMPDAMHLLSTSGLEIVRSGNQLDITLHRAGGIAARFVFTRTQAGGVIVGSGGYGTVKIARAGNEIYVSQNGSLLSTVTIKSMS
ncbi:MAG TPA: hypothetical protein VMW69_16775 [Spirochaetia bacterium]|nr:hypothetical protein [Spirochaetia bacterium]